MRHAACIGAALVAVAIGAGAAGGGSRGLEVSLGRSVAAPGDLVAVRVKAPPRLRGAPLRIALHDSEQRLLLASLRVGRKGIGRAHVTVPNVPPGVAAVRVECPRCRGRVAVSRPLRVVEAPPVVRDCESSIYGELRPGWEERSLRAGPLALVGARSAPAPAARRPAYWEPIKFVLVLENGARATLRVREDDRRHVALLYAQRGGLGRFAEARVADGLPAVTFEGCTPSEAPHTQFNGGFVVDGPRCAHLEVHVTGRADPIPLTVSFGRDC